MSLTALNLPLFERTRRWRDHNTHPGRVLKREDEQFLCSGGDNGV